MLPVYVTIMAILGSENVEIDIAGLILGAAYLVLFARSLGQLLSLPFKTTCSHAIFGLASVNSDGRPAGIGKLFLRRMLIWNSLLIPAWCIGHWTTPGTIQQLAGGTVWLLIWLSAAFYAVMHPNRGLQDRILNTWVVRR